MKPLDILQDACRHLAPGQMVFTDGFNSMDAMAAIEILHPQMDSAVMHRQIEYDDDGDDLELLSTIDVIWIMDHIFACEAVWLDARSIYNSIPLRSLVSAKRTSPLTRHVLTPFVQAISKSMELVLIELSKGNVLDGEDYSGDRASLGLLEDLDVQHTIIQIDEALSWIRSSVDIAADAVEALTERMWFCKAFLNITALISTLQHSMDIEGETQHISAFLHQYVHLLSRMDSTSQDTIIEIPFSSPDPASAPSNAARRAVDIGLQIAQTPMPVTPSRPSQVGTASQMCVTFRQIATGIHEFCDLLLVDRSWARWKPFFDSKAHNFQQQVPAPYLRSLWQSAVCCENVIAMRLPFISLADNYVEFITGFDMVAVQNALRGAVNGQPAAAAVVGRTNTSLETRMMLFKERLAGQLVAHLRNLAQNRSRGRRCLAKSHRELVALGKEASAIGIDLSNILGNTSIPSDFLHAALQVLALDTMHHVVKAGFELDLYRPDEHDFQLSVLRKIEDDLRALLDPSQDANAIARNGLSTRQSRSGPPPPLAWPMFAKRFKWMQVQQMKDIWHSEEAGYT